MPDAQSACGLAESMQQLVATVFTISKYLEYPILIDISLPMVVQVADLTPCYNAWTEGPLIRIPLMSNMVGFLSASFATSHEDCVQLNVC